MGSPRGGRAITLYWGEPCVIVIDNYSGTDTATKNTTTGHTYDSLDRLQWHVAIRNPRHFANSGIKPFQMCGVAQLV